MLCNKQSPNLSGLQQPNVFFSLRVWGLADHGCVWLGWAAIRGTWLRAVIVLGLVHILSLGPGLLRLVAKEQKAKPTQLMKCLCSQHLASAVRPGLGMGGREDNCLQVQVGF